MFGNKIFLFFVVVRNNYIIGQAFPVFLVFHIFVILIAQNIFNDKLKIRYI